MSNENFHSIYSISRTMFFIWVFIFLASDDYLLQWQNVPSELWLGTGLNTGLIHVREMIPWGLLSMIWKISLVLCILGLFERSASFISFLAATLFFMQAQGFGYFKHSFLPLWWVMLFFIFSPPVYLIRYAVFASFFKRMPQFLLTDLNSHIYLSREQCVFLVRFVFCLVFFTAGLSKLINGGLDWATTENLEKYVLRAWVIHREFAPPGAEFVNKILFKYPFLFGFSALLTLLVELFCPLMLFYNKLKWFFLPVLLIMQTGVRFTLMVDFTSYLCLYTFWFNLSNPAISELTMRVLRKLKLFSL